MRKIISAGVVAVGLGVSLAACHTATTAASSSPSASATPSTAAAASYSSGQDYGYHLISFPPPGGVHGTSGEVCKTGLATVLGKNAPGRAQWLSGCEAGVDEAVNDVKTNGKPAPPAKITKAKPKPTGPTVTFIVKGSYADVTYGPEGSSYQGSVPMDKTFRIAATPPLFYNIDAQLQGGGQVTCEIAVNGHVISTGEAQGGYNLATCEIDPSILGSGVDNTGWENTQS